MQSLTNDTPTTSRGRTARRLLLALTGAIFLCAIFLLLLDAALHKQLNHDENMYLSSGILLRDGLLPYKDYPYFQMPLLTLVYAVATWGAADPLFTARLLNTLFAFAACLLLFFGALRLARDTPLLVRATIAVSGVVLFVANPELVYASGLAWNHDLPILLTVGGILFLARAYTPTVTAASFVRTNLVLGGLLLGLAAITRLTFAIPIPLIAIFLLLVPPSTQEGIVSRIRYCALFAGGVLVGLSPALFFFLADPSSFLFGNVTYHGLNEQVLLQSGYTRAMTPGSKLAYFSGVLFGQPFNWLVLFGSVLVLVMVAFTSRRRQDNAAPAIYLPAIAALALLLGAFVPSPTWLQYFYAPCALAVFSIVYGLAYLSAGNWRYLATPALAAAALVSAIAISPTYTTLDGTFALSDSVPAQIESAAQQIHNAVGKGTVATLAPIYPLEAGLSIYPQLTAGPFAPRVAGLVPDHRRQQLGVLSGDDLAALMQAMPPSAILTGIEGALEDPLTNFATQHGYRKIALPGGLTLWVRGST